MLIPSNKTKQIDAIDLNEDALGGVIKIDDSLSAADVVRMHKNGIKRQVEFIDDICNFCWAARQNNKIKMQESFDSFIKSIFENNVKLIVPDKLEDLKREYKEIIQLANNAASPQSLNDAFNILNNDILKILGDLLRGKAYNLFINYSSLVGSAKEEQADLCAISKKICDAFTNVLEQNIYEQILEVLVEMESKLQKHSHDSADSPTLADTVGCKQKEAGGANVQANNPADLLEFDSECSVSAQTNGLCLNDTEELPSTNVSSAQEDLVCQSRRNLSI